MKPQPGQKNPQQQGEPENIISIDRFKELDGLGKVPAHCTLRKPTSCQAKQVEGIIRGLEFIISDENVDRDGDVLMASGWSLQNYRANPVVLFAHDYHRPAIGKSVRVEIQGGQLISVDQFAPPEVSAFADEIYQLVLGGYMNATSVGFQPLEWVWVEEQGGWRFTSQDLLEHSVVPVPANPHALQLAFSKGLRFPELTGWFEKLMDGDAGESQIFVPRPSMEQAYQLHTPSKTYLLPACHFSKSERPGMTKLAGDLFISTEVADQLGDLADVEVKETTFTEGIDMSNALDRKRAIVREALAIVNAKSDADVVSIMAGLEGRAKAAGFELPWQKNADAWNGFFKAAVDARKDFAGSEWEGFELPTRKLAGMLTAAGFKSEGDDLSQSVALADGEGDAGSESEAEANADGEGDGEGDGEAAGDPPADNPPAADPPADAGAAVEAAATAAVEKYLKEKGIEPGATVSENELSELMATAKATGEELAAGMREAFDKNYMAMTGEVPDGQGTH